MTEEITKAIQQATNVCLIPSEHEPESLTAALALFYTLKELGKNANIIINTFPEKLHFLVPSLDFITSPKNVVIAIPRSLADISQVYYEKSEENLKIHLTVERGELTKEGISFYFSEPKPDLVITLGIKNLQDQLSERLDSFGFLLDTPILNIDTQMTSNINNQFFGVMNVVEPKSISEITFDIIRSLGEPLITKPVATCLLAGLVIHYDNFKKHHTSPEALHLAAELIQRGALHHQIHDNLHKMTKQEMDFVSSIFQNLETADRYEGSIATLEANEFWGFGADEAHFAVEKIKAIGVQNDMLVLWQSHSSEPIIKGFFYSKNPDAIHKVAEKQQGVVNDGWVFLSMPGSDMSLVKERIINLLV